ncbi:hypothetical protein GCM10025771_36070 [Niveibacterium umoris]|uniref:Transmembrane protein n=1 Tax=Niveibacterium umoris TaxID=1193620 RepID=A0A840BJX1_9RHOO|nr:hypothetical protein [Niveibacterium umoris]MBB4011196.1 hypothetical protein [Niveibacterium umoris]
MYIIAIAWIYVALMAAVGAESIVGGIMTFSGFIFPLALILWLGGSRARRRRRAEKEALEDQPVTPPEDSPPSR